MTTLIENRRIRLPALTKPFENYEELREWIKCHAPEEAGYEVVVTEIIATTEYNANGEARYLHYRVKKII